MPPSDLQQRLLAAHAENDRSALIDLYLEASNSAETEDASGFFLTHAYVYALEAGDERAPALKSRLIELKRDVSSAKMPEKKKGQPKLPRKFR